MNTNTKVNVTKADIHYKGPNRQRILAGNDSFREDDGFVITNANIVKPQAKFEDKVDNSRSPFVPILLNKHNAVVPWKGPQVILF